MGRRIAGDYSAGIESPPAFCSNHRQRREFIHSRHFPNHDLSFAFNPRVGFEISGGAADADAERRGVSGLGEKNLGGKCLRQTSRVGNATRDNLHDRREN